MSLSMQKCFKRRNWEIWELWRHLFDSVQVCEATEVNEGDGLRRQGWRGRSRFTAHHGARWCRFACGDGKGTWLWHVAVCHRMSPLRHTHTHTIFKINFDQIWSDLIIFVLSTIFPKFTMQPTLYVMIVMKDKHDMKFDLMAMIWDDLIDLQWHMWTNMDKAFLHFSSHVIMMSSCLFSPFPPRLCQILASVAHVDAQLAEMALWLGEGVARGQKASNASVQEVPSCCRIVGIHWFCWNHDGKSNEKYRKIMEVGGELYEQGLNAKHIANLTSAGHVRVIEYIYIYTYYYYKMQKTWHVKCNIVQQVCLLWPFWRSWDCAASCSAVFGKMLSTARWAGDVFSKVCRSPKTMQNSYSDDGDDGRMISSWGFHPYDLWFLCFSRILLAILSYHVL